MFNLTSEAHLAGTPENKRTGEYVHEHFREAGLTVYWEPFDALISSPVDHAVQVVAPSNSTYNCSLTEPPVAGDPTSQLPNQVPTFNGYAANGDVTKELVFANYGTVEDFEFLERQNISVEDRIVIVKYGQNFRGVKVYLAQKRGAAGVLIYSDPKDDGFTKGAVYPDGPWRPEQGVQRGSVQFLNICPGDPRRVLDCLGDATANFTGNLIPSIPVHPLSWGDAQHLLSALEGNVAPPEWQGTIPGLEYKIGPGPAVVRVYSHQNFTVEELYNVVGEIEGTDPSLGPIVLGNHRDAWVFGGADPNSGTAVLMELATAFGELLKTGWRPRRTIKLCSWDGEEYALLGSVDWADKHAADLQKAVAYLNVDVAVCGPNFTASASPALSRVLLLASGLVNYSNTSTPLNEVWDRNIGVLGSGSDFTAFVHHLGVASLDLSFSGSYGVYHSIYDSYTWMARYGDPDFLLSKTMTQLWGTIALMLSEPVLVPLWYNDTAAELHKYYATVNGSKLGNVTLNTQPLSDAIAHFTINANALAMDMEAVLLGSKSEVEAGMLNLINVEAERKFLDNQGLPGRPYFKHTLQAPGIFLGYGSNVFPGLTEAIRDNNTELANQQVTTIAGAIRTASDALRPTPAPAPAPAPADDSGLSAGAKAGISIAVLFVAAVGGYFGWKKCSKADEYQKF